MRWRGWGGVEVYKYETLRRDVSMNLEERVLGRREFGERRVFAGCMQSTIREVGP